ncbi:MAG TPA: hypothetical protein VFT37_04220 [Telluria sp.]|nr:hypothetical protein [Telluria sp.]
MKDKKDNATFELPGLGAAWFAPPSPKDAAPESRSRVRRSLPKQEQLTLLDETDTSGLPVWRRDDGLDLTGLPVWASN